MDPVSRMVSRSALCTVTFCVLTFLVSGTGLAQLPQTQVLSIFPAGGQVGTEIEVKVVAGADLDELSALSFSHPGIVARQKTTEPDGKGTPVANTFVVKIAKDVLPGFYECSARGLFGESNPRRFCISSEATGLEAEANNDMAQATPIELEQRIYGSLGGAADVDLFRFEGRKGQSIVVVTNAESLDSRLVTALELFSGSGRRLAYVRNVDQGDPVLAFQLPDDGAYFVKVYDFTYRNGSDYFYQLMVSERPWIVAMDPPVLAAGGTNRVKLLGYNLPGGKSASMATRNRPLQQLEIDVTAPANSHQLPSSLPIAPAQAGLDAFSFRWDSPRGLSNERLVPFTSVAPVQETEPNDASDNAQKIPVPGVAVGSFGQRGDVDIFEFEATAGSVLMIDVSSHRIGSGGDPYFILDQVVRDAEGKETSVKRLTTQDDIATNLGGNDFNTQTADAEFRLAVPADGTYRISVRDRYFEARGNALLQYRLSVRPEKPGFRVVSLTGRAPAAANQPYTLGTAVVRRGGTADLRVMAFRQDGFKGAIRIEAGNLPRGVQARPLVLGGDATSGSLVIHAAEDAQIGDLDLQLNASADVDDPVLERELDAAQKAIDPARKALKAAEDALAKLVSPRDAAQQKLSEAEAVLKEKPDDDAATKAVEQARKALESAQAKVDTSTGARDDAAGKLKMAEDQVTAANARLMKSRVRTTHPVRSAALVWTGANNAPARSRLSNRVRLSVIEEAAPFEVAADLNARELTVHQGRQLLVPVEVIKRAGFDSDVSMTWMDVVKNSKVTAENKTVKKGSTAETLKIAVDKSAPEGDYTLFLRTAGQVPYSRNPGRVERARQEQEKAAETASKAAEDLKKFTAERDESKKQLADTDKKIADLNATIKKQQSEVTTATGKQQASEKAAVKAQEDLDKATAERKTAADALKAADDQLANDAENEDLKKAKESAAKTLATAEEAVKSAMATQQTAAKVAETSVNALRTAEQDLKKSSDGLGAEQKRQAEIKTMLAAREEQVKKSDAVNKQATTVKAAADKEFKDAEAAAKPKNINYFPASVPLVLHVRKAPFSMAAAVPDGGNLKKGASVDIKVTLTRQPGFNEPVQLSLDHAGELKGITIAAEAIPGDSSEGLVKVTASGEAAESAVPYAAIRAVSGKDGSVIINAPVTLKIVK